MVQRAGQAISMDLGQCPTQRSFVPVIRFLYSPNQIRMPTSVVRYVKICLLSLYCLITIKKSMLAPRLGHWGNIMMQLQHIGGTALKHILLCCRISVIIIEWYCLFIEQYFQSNFKSFDAMLLQRLLGFECRSAIMSLKTTSFNSNNYNTFIIGIRPIF